MNKTICGWENACDDVRQGIGRWSDVMRVVGCHVKELINQKTVPFISDVNDNVYLLNDG